MVRLRLLSAWLPANPAVRARLQQTLLRVLVAANLALGLSYLSWRYLDSINWAAWPIALALLAAETYSYVDAWLLGLTVWRIRRRGEPPSPPEGAAVDVFITRFDEPVEVVRETVRAAVAISYPHRTYILDDSVSPAVRALAEAEGVGYIVRSGERDQGRRHSKAGNLNHALFQTDGELILVLDADQIASPEILDRTLGYFRDPKVAFVQTPEAFVSVPPGDPFGSRSPRLGGLIEQGRDGWNAAAFRGAGAVLRREALMQLGIAEYVRELDARVPRALELADRLLRRTQRQLSAAEPWRIHQAIRDLRAVVADARRELHAGAPIQQVTWEFQRRVEEISRMLVRIDLAHIRAELADMPGVDSADVDGPLDDAPSDEDVLRVLAGRESSPLAAIGTVRALVRVLDVDLSDQAQPLMPMATISVTEELATALRLHALGWRSVYHHEPLARGRAPVDLPGALRPRLRRAQGAIQVLLRDNPLTKRGLSFGQRAMYLASMWCHLSGLFTVAYLAAPLLYLLFGVLPVRELSDELFRHLVPYLVASQLMLTAVGRGLPGGRSRRYDVALFPLWIRAVHGAVRNVYFGRALDDLATSGAGRLGARLAMVWPQLTAAALLAGATLVGLRRLILEPPEDQVAILLNMLWAGYGLLALSVIWRAAARRPADASDDAAQPVLGSADPGVARSAA